MILAAAVVMLLPSARLIADDTTGQPEGRKSRLDLPNFVIIFTDDQGYADIGCFGAEGFETPHLDKLAERGMRFTDFYVSEPVCSASRTSLLTGCYAKRLGIRGALGPHAKIGVDPAEDTIADVLKREGYATCAIGKWHLGHRREFLPLQQGFDEYLGIPYSNDMWPVHYDGKQIEKDSDHPKKWKANHPQLPLIDGNEKVDEFRTLESQNSITTRYTERAVKFIESHVDEPFFLYLAHTMVHVPLGVSDKFKGKSEQGMYGDTMMEIDWSVGEVVAALERNNLLDNTVIVYTSDNGPWMNYGNHAGQVGPLREAKGTTWDGGVRVPCIMSWPGHIPAGSECNQLASTLDLLPTFTHLADGKLPERPIDGVNILPLMLGQTETSPRDHIVFYYSNRPECIRMGQWKLHAPHGYRSYEGVEPGNDGWPGPYGKGEVTEFELYDLENDIGERNNVAAQYPEVVEKMTKLIMHYRETLGFDKEQGTEVRGPARIKDEPAKEQG
jgi:arylsulfatase